MTACDICNSLLNWEDGLILTNQQVLTSEQFWEYSFSHQEFSRNRLSFHIQYLSGHTNGWLVCESCSSLFNFNWKKAKYYARHRLAHPPGGGPIDANLVAEIAMPIWMKRH